VSAPCWVLIPRGICLVERIDPFGEEERGGSTWPFLTPRCESIVDDILEVAREWPGAEGKGTADDAEGGCRRGGPVCVGEDGRDLEAARGLEVDPF
jgi:hypothetical protein